MADRLEASGKSIGEKKFREDEDTDIRSGLENGIRTVPAERRV